MLNRICEEEVKNCVETARILRYPNEEPFENFPVGQFHITVTFSMNVDLLQKCLLSTLKFFDYLYLTSV